MPTPVEWWNGRTESGRFLAPTKVESYRTTLLADPALMAEHGLIGSPPPLPTPERIPPAPGSQAKSASTQVFNRTSRAATPPLPPTEPELIALGKERTTTGIRDLHSEAPWRSCIHRGDKIRDLQNCGCGAMDKGIYHCGRGGECVKQRATTLQREATIKAGIRICDECALAVAKEVVPIG